MSKKISSTTKSKQNEQAQLLALLKKVLPKATHDAELAGKIYQAIEAELRTKNQAVSFDKFCDRIPLPDLEAKTLDEVKLQLTSAFSEGDVTIQPNKKDKSLSVEVVLPDPCRPTIAITAGLPDRWNVRSPADRSATSSSLTILTTC